MTRYFFIWMGLVMILFGCSPKTEVKTKEKTHAFIENSKPYARYWWFASEIKKEDVEYNLDWLKENGFGGVEIAWVYPLNRMNKNDSSITPRYEWLGADWQKVVEYTILYADSIGLGCDMTFGTLWPFGDSYVTFDEATQKYNDSEWRQEITASWEYPKNGYVVDHLKPNHYEKYFKRLLDFFPRPTTKISQSYFIDSWEVETEYLWTEGFKEDFLQKYGYDITAFMDSIYTEKYAMQRYDYMKLISEKVIQFYEDFDKSLNAEGIYSRGQCSGAPCDIISAYAKLDIPEGEAMLYEPEFNAIPASAALLSSKKVVSAETFTCLYGWPRDYLRNEQTADLKLLADALFANGINQIVWHGKPHNPKGYDTVSFYASVHVGKDGALADEIREFNRYLENVSCLMKKGNTYSDVAVYLPTEDAWIKGEMPKDKQFIWAWGFYEMRYVYFPEELKGHHPIWINQEFLEKAVVENGKLKVGNASFNSLYMDAKYLDLETLKVVYKIAETGFPVVLKMQPQEAGFNKNAEFREILNKLSGMSNIKEEFHSTSKPLIEGESIPPYWCREENGNLYMFFANPKSAGLKFPIEYGQSFTEKDSLINITINYLENSYEVKLHFKPYKSLIYKIENGKLEEINFDFIPKTPKVIERPDGYQAPWLVE